MQYTARGADTPLRATDPESRRHEKDPERGAGAWTGPLRNRCRENGAATGAEPVLPHASSRTSTQGVRKESPVKITKSRVKGGTRIKSDRY